MTLITKDHKQSLTENMEAIKQHIPAPKLAPLLTELEAEGVINCDQKETVNSKDITANKVETLVNFLRKGTEEEYYGFLKALSLSNIKLDSLADLIEGGQSAPQSTGTSM